MSMLESQTMMQRCAVLAQDWLRAGSAFWIAFAGSAVIHGMLAWMTPTFVESFTPVKVARYDATLTPIQQIKPSPPRPPPRARAPRAVAPATPPAMTPAPEATIASSEIAASAEANATDRVALAPPPDDPPIERSPKKSAEDAELPRAVNVDPPAAAPLATPRRAPPFGERITIEYKLTSNIIDGVASFNWRRRGVEYEIESSIQASGFLVSVFAGVIHQQSSGSITDEGLRPRHFSIRRGDGGAETAEFRRESNALSLKRGNNTRTLPLARDMQDMQSFLFQLAYDAPSLSDTGEQLDVLVTNARKVYRYQFRRVGTETLATELGPVETIRLLSAAANPEDQYEVWLAPGYFYLPVKLRYYLGRFQVEQLATRIGVSDDAAAGKR